MSYLLPPQILLKDFCRLIWVLFQPMSPGKLSRTALSVRGQSLSGGYLFLKNVCRPFLWGGKPRKTNSSVGNPLILSAAIAAFGPGIGTIFKSGIAFKASFTK